MKQKMLVVSAHISDILLSCAGSIARYAKDGHEVHIVVLTNSNEENEINTDLGQNCSTGDDALVALTKLLGAASIQTLNYAAYPLNMEKDQLETLATIMRRVRPDFILTHDQGTDYGNFDHNATSKAVRDAYQIASGAGAYCEGLKVSPRQTPIFGFEPYQSELCGFVPKICLDISQTIEIKRQAQQLYGLHLDATEHFERIAQVRAGQKNAATKTNDCNYAEMFSSYGPIAAHGYFVW